MEDEMITTTQAGEMLGVTGETIRDWIRNERIEAIKTPGGKFRVRLSSIKRLLGEPENSQAIQPQ